MQKCEFMTILSVLQFPSPKLKLVAKHIERFDASLVELYNNMLETMYGEEGIGLAATQVDVQLRMFVMDISETKKKPLCFINPKIISTEGELIWEEGCLSFPGVYANVKRHQQITVEYQDLNGAVQQCTAEEIMAVCIQHEMDHLDGITFFDHLSPLKRQMLTKKLAKQRDNIS